MKFCWPHPAFQHPVIGKAIAVQLINSGNLADFATVIFLFATLVYLMTIESAIPLFSAVAANSGIDLRSATTRVIDSHWYVLGQEVSAFESEFAAYTGVNHCVTVANGTDALMLALRASGVGAGDLVALVANAGFYGSTALHLIGATPLYIEIDEANLTMSAQALSDAIACHPKAVVVTHLFGQLAAIEEIADICRTHGILLIEDCAQSHGAMRNGKRAGSFGDIAAFSFYPTKNLGALGDGGAITTSTKLLADKVRTLRQYGWSQKYTVSTPLGCNSRLDEIQAAVLREKLPHLDRQNAQRRSIAIRYNNAFSRLPLRCPPSVGEDYVAHLYVVRTHRRQELREYLLSQGVSTDVHYPVADHLQPAYSNARPVKALPRTEEACASALSLPCFPGLTDSEVDRVITAVQGFFSAFEAATC
jgi:dTDP-3-amino-2,3,6-trideoxy-4-keto-D-glucose/dTDP-3-amino-3,4,6-trideoxy-alpha-D-glucose/dTDP-2,6-dideoxy-D-kanosamine transaminase